MHTYIQTDLGGLESSEGTRGHGQRVQGAQGENDKTHRSSRQQPLYCTASSQWLHSSLNTPHLIPEPGQMALQSASPLPGREGVAPGHPEPPTMFPEAFSTPPPPRLWSEATSPYLLDLSPIPSPAQGSPQTAGTPALGASHGRRESMSLTLMLLVPLRNGDSQERRSPRWQQA